MEFLRPRKPGLSLDMAPLIDIVFQLLIFFMLSSSFLNPVLKLNLPKAATQDEVKNDRIVISVDREGSVFVNQEKSSMAQLQIDIQSKLANIPDKSVQIRGDQDMPYKYFVETMDHARKAGARQVNIVHESAES